MEIRVLLEALILHLFHCEGHVGRAVSRAEAALLIGEYFSGLRMYT